MWFWEVIFQSITGTHSLYSLVGYSSEEEAYQIFVSSKESIFNCVTKNGGFEIVDIQIVYKTSGELYSDGGCL